MQEKKAENDIENKGRAKRHESNATLTYSISTDRGKH